MSASLRTVIGGMLVPMALVAQVTVVEEGSFTLVRRGVRVGREDFSIRRVQTVSTTSFVAQANVVEGDRRRTVVLRTDSAGGPTRYRRETLVSGRSAEVTSGEARGGLWSGRTESALGESAREFRLPQGALAGDEDIAHQSWFLFRFQRGEPIPVLQPLAFRLTPLTIVPAGTDLLRIGTVEVESQRWTVRAGERLLREFWTDARGHLLRVRVPESELEAVRDELPG